MHYGTPHSRRAVVDVSGMSVLQHTGVRVGSTMSLMPGRGAARAGV